METIKKYRRTTVIAATLVILSCWAGTYVAAGMHAPDQPKASWLPIVAVFMSLAATTIAFLVASILSGQDADRLERILRNTIAESIEGPTTLGEVPWAELIENADAIDFVVQGWDGWGERDTIPTALQNFFSRKGTFRLYVCSPDSPGASHARALLAERISRPPFEVKVEITNTFRKINEARELVPMPQRGPPIELYETDHLNWYFAALFTGKSVGAETRVRDVLVLSVYAHTNRRPWYMPAQMIYPDMQGNYFREWFQKELKHLRDGSPQGNSRREAASEQPKDSLGFQT